jgi:endonuclease/exonuclease/phosphatase family metal-dependent hydrolase
MSPRDDTLDGAPSLRVATWNVEWAKPGSERGERVRAVLAGLAADILIVTEGSAAVLPEGGHIIDAGADWGYGDKPERRKVLAWSRTPWTDVETIDVGASRGRVVSARTETVLGEIEVISVCIPWRDAHVRTGRRDARPWSEHLECCSHLVDRPIGPRTVIAGDFNQRIPRIRQPIAVAVALDQVLTPFTVWTGGDTDAGPLIDHIATTPDLRCSAMQAWAGRDVTGRLSDHAGVAVHLESSY